jgi:hypothetical protein
VNRKEQAGHTAEGGWEAVQEGICRSVVDETRRRPGASHTPRGSSAMKRKQEQAEKEKALSAATDRAEKIL